MRQIPVHCITFRGFLLVLVIVFSKDQHIFASTLDSYEMSTMCGRSLNMNWKSVYMVEVTFDPFIGKNHSNPVTSCDLGIISWHHMDQIMIRFTRLNTGRNCSESHVQVLDGPSATSPPLLGMPGAICGAGVKRLRRRTFASSDREITLRYVGSPNSTARPAFTVHIVAFHTGRCMSYEHQCDNGRCIWGELACNGHNPCGDDPEPLCVLQSSDVEVEVGQVASSPSSDSQTVVAIIVSSAALLTLACLILFLYFRWNRRRKRELERHDVAPAGNAPVLSSSTEEPNVDVTRFRSPPSYSSLQTQAPCPKSVTRASSSSSPALSDSEEACSLMSSSDNRDSDKTQRTDPCFRDNDSSEDPPPPSYMCAMTHKKEFNVSTSRVDQDV